MGQKKLLRFSQIKSFRNVLEYPENMRGQWNRFFGNQHPLTLELACGRGEYTVGLATMHPENNYVGVDVKGNRIYLGAKKALDEQLNNAAFLRTQIEMIGEYFGDNEVDEIWITFPDPQLRWSKSKHRLTHPRFLRTYKKFLKPGGLIHLKTDSPDLFRFTLTVIDLFQLELIDGNADVYGGAQIAPELKIKTHYEKLDIAGSNKIHYLCFRITKELPVELDETLRNITRDVEQAID